MRRLVLFAVAFMFALTTPVLAQNSAATHGRSHSAAAAPAKSPTAAHAKHKTHKHRTHAKAHTRHVHHGHTSAAARTH